MKYQIILELPVRPNPGDKSHFAALLRNPQTASYIVEIKEIEDHEV